MDKLLMNPKEAAEMLSISRSKPRFLRINALSR
jgi:hypothetical protein